MRQIELLLGGINIEPRLRGAITAQVVQLARNPNPAGQFFRDTVDVRKIDDDKQFISALQDLGYECLVTMEDGQFGGLFGFQKHKDGWHTFAYNVPVHLENRGIGTGMMKELLLKWKVDCQRNRIRLSAGDEARALDDKNRAAAQRLYEKVVGNELDLPFKMRPIREEATGWAERHW